MNEIDATYFSVLPLRGSGALILSPNPASLLGLNLEQAITTYAQNGAKVLLSLTTQAELIALELGHLGLTCRSQGIQWWHAPIEDLDAPDAAFEQWWSGHRSSLHALLNDGQVLAIHCWSGFGRSGTVAAKLLVERGMTPSQALEMVRACRPGSVETEGQEQYVLNLATPF
jgi:protein-tyrosine phosphatase